MSVLDRRVTLRFSRTFLNRFGESETETTERGIWAGLLQDSVARSLTAEGAYGLASKTYRIRYAADLLVALEGGNTVNLIDGTETMVVAGAGEPRTADRRRFLDISISE